MKLEDLPRDKRIQIYIHHRDEIAKRKKAFEADIAPLKKRMDDIERLFLDEFNTNGENSANTDYGTAYTTTRTSASVADWDTLLGFVRENDLWHLLTQGVSKTAVEEYLAAKEELPPGVNIRRELAVNIRR